MGIVEYLNKLLGGCGVESEKLELMGILRQIAEEYQAGRITEQELETLLNKLCMSLSVLANNCGKPLTQDKCVQDLKNEIKKEMTRGFRELLRTLRTRPTTSTSTGIIP